MIRACARMVAKQLHSPYPVTLTAPREALGVALALAERLAHPHSLAHGLMNATLTVQILGDPIATELRTAS